LALISFICRLDPFVGIDVGDQRGQDVVAVLGHLRAQRSFDRLRDFILLEEDVVKVEARHVRAHHVEDEGGNLRRRVGEAVIRLVNLVGKHRELHGHRDVDENVVAGFGFDLDRQLLHAQVDVGDDLVDEWDFEIESCARDPQIFPEALDDRDFLLFDGEPRAEQHDQSDHHYDRYPSQDQNIRRAVHCFCFPPPLRL